MPDLTGYPEWLKNLIRTRGMRVVGGNPAAYTPFAAQSTRDQDWASRLVNYTPDRQQEWASRLVDYGKTAQEPGISRLVEYGEDTVSGRDYAELARANAGARSISSQDVPAWLKEGAPAQYGGLAEHATRSVPGPALGGGIQQTQATQSRRMDYQYFRDLEKYIKEKGKTDRRYTGNTIYDPIWDNDTGRLAGYNVIRRDGQGNIRSVTKGVSPDSIRSPRLGYGHPTKRQRNLWNRQGGTQYSPQQSSDKRKKSTVSNTVGASGNWLHSMMSWTG